VEFRKICLKIMRGVSQRWLKLRVQLQSGFHKIRVKFEPKLRVISEVCETPYSLLTKTPSSCIIGPLTHLCHFLGLSEAVLTSSPSCTFEWCWWIWAS